MKKALKALVLTKNRFA